MRDTKQELEQIHLAAVGAAKNLKTAEAHLILCLQRVDESKAYLHLKYESLYSYALSELKLTEDQAYVFKLVAQKAAKLPDLQRAILKGEVTVSKAKRVMSVINETNEAEWVDLLKTQSKRTIEKAVAEVSPRAVVQEKAKYVSKNILELTLAISEENLAKIKRAQDLLSQKWNRAATMEETLTHLAEAFNDKHDPVQKAERAPKTAARREKSGPGRTKPAHVYHEVHKRDQGKCQAQTPNGEPCHQTKWTDVHHIKEVSRGGDTTPENLMTLCRAHHRMQHQNVFH